MFPKEYRCAAISILKPFFMALIEFYGKECPHCLTMMPLVETLKGEGFTIEQFETWHNAENAKTFEEYDKGRCGGVPFFVNTDSGEIICGATDEDTLRRWAKGEKM